MTISAKLPFTVMIRATGFRLRIARAVLLMFLGALFFAAPALAHPVPFSYLDVHVDRNMINVTLVAHVFDVAHELRVEPPELLLDPSVLGALNGAVTALFQSRLHIASGGRALEGASPVSHLVGSS